MATKPKSYKKDGYTYTESAPGSKKFQNFTAAKPTVKAVRDESRADKAKVAVKKVSTSKPGESKMAQAEATRKPRGKEKRYPSAEDRKMETVGQSKRFPPAPAKPKAAGQEQRFRPAPMAKGVSGSDAKGKRGVGVRFLRYFGYTAGTKTMK